jgi:hypothetical protein
MNREKKIKGSWLDDEFLSLIKRHKEFQETQRDGMKFAYEVQRVGNNLFQLREDENYFTIQHPNKIVQDHLNAYFISDYGRYRRNLYGNHFHLGNLFNDIMQSLVIYGEVFYALDWQEIQMDKTGYKLPSNFRYLRSSTMSYEKDYTGSIVKFIQKYTPFARLPDDLPRSVVFKKNEIFYTKYPLDDTHPVKKSMYLLKTLLGFWKMGINRSDSPKNKRLNVVWAKQKRFSEEKRKYALARAKVRANFHYLLNIEDLTITEYFDIYSVAKYLKELNDVRNYFIEQFNLQVLKPFAQKNSLKVAPKLELRNYMTNQEIDDYFEKYKQKKIKSKEFIENVVNKER